MSVYCKDDPGNFDISVQSMLSQTLPPDEVVLVCDGPIDGELNEVVEKYSQNPIFNVITLEQNFGLSTALNVGLLQCNNEYVLRMDSDDISAPNRAEKEIAVLDAGFDIVGSSISEFVGDSKNIIGYRRVPTNHNDIVKFSKKRTPFNHPSVAFKKSSVLSAGNYSCETRYMQDYYLWVRCIQAGCKCCNIDEALVNMRSGLSMRARRKGKDFTRSYKTIFKYMLKTKYIGFFRFCINNLSFFIYSHLSPNVKEKIVYKYLREKK